MFSKTSLLIVLWISPLAFAGKNTVLIAGDKCLDGTGATFVANVKDVISQSADFEVANTRAMFFVSIVCVDASDYGYEGSFSAVSTLISVRNGKELDHSVFIVARSTVRARAEEFLHNLRDVRASAQR